MVNVDHEYDIRRIFKAREYILEWLGVGGISGIVCVKEDAGDEG